MEKKPDFKAMSTKSKIEYVWDYYKWHILGGIAGLALVASTIHHFVTYRDPLLNVIMINSNDPYNISSDGFSEFQDLYGYDSDDYPVYISSYYVGKDDDESNTYYQEYQAFSTKIAAGGQDLFFGTGDVYLSYCEMGVFADLSTILSPEQLEEYAKSDSLIYSTADGELDPYPCAIKLSGNEWLSQNNYYDECYFGVLYRNQNFDACKQFTEFLLAYK